MIKIPSALATLLLYALKTIHGYNVIVNNTNFLFSGKDAHVGGDLKETWGGEAERVEWPGEGSALESAAAFLKSNWGVENRVESDHEQNDDVPSGQVHHFGSSNHNVDRQNEQSHQENQGGGNDGEDERSKMFNLAMELKDGLNNRKKNLNRSINIFEQLIRHKKDKITSSSYYELGKIHFIGYQNYFFSYKRNLKLSIHYLERASRMGNPAALHFLAFLYFFDFNVQGDGSGHKGGDKGGNRYEERSSLSHGDEKDEEGGPPGKKKKTHIIMRNPKRKNITRGKATSNDSNRNGNLPHTDPPASHNNRTSNTHIKTSIEYELQACAQNYTPSVLAIAYKYLYGINIKSSCEKAKEFYKSVAENVMNADYINVPLSEMDVLNVDNLSIQNEINNMKDNEEDVLEFLNEQIKGGDVMAMYDLGKKYKEERNFSKAFEYINEASKKNNALAQKEMGIIYLYGYGTERDVRKSIESFSKAAAAGDVESKCYLGYIYYFVDGHRDVQQALKYLVEAAKHDYGEAFFFLAEIILDVSIKKHHIADIVYRTIFKLYEHAADLGYVQAYFREAQLYEIGKGVQASCVNAALSYKFVAESTMWTNQIREGMNYYVQKDYIKAFYTYALAAYEGYEVAQSNLIYIYRTNGFNSFIKPEKIMQMLHLMYKQGNYKALYEIGNIYKQENKDSVAISYHRLGLNKGDLRNLVPLSVYYEKNMDPDRALKYLNYFLKQRTREKPSNSTKVEKIRTILESSLLYFRKFKLLFKSFYSTKQKKRE
ncbi:ubiquitin-protein ligase, putative [Plasmodium knowlesi strain H]|uniref:Ubiquitin-protein ligase, putative n=3 Tax=Plasmodium knowlesi TaxID=5850 RepID=A0A5K1UFT3_PLAKH|nr:ubiquitin-protein ligase, putative [Plasmodium knowlesi strain H]OTN65774.1 putative Ubiquitin-protein ligase [Plasmodium knowlesi]CAA9987934.1 ubiquitin-protein ligase, putative [Plasmodium knowlesi strain H]SBO22212.1 ubiquitin-protein ligase, putative [Plasmodium knowlesi strain H]SBO28867.1 ubiquitin-protein ligase, putative [Plasmodium knowlesi strain H]VVS77408.1 ubiquitin-protein ligase, putative [Plasmodium knowlesi strain H]|eukprot:XP_002258915.1 hypothetical protein, conserved in Plasmodium species [Plasmodium knowlesi strain H]